MVWGAVGMVQYGTFRLEICVGNFIFNLVL